MLPITHYIITILIVSIFWFAIYSTASQNWQVKYVSLQDKWLSINSKYEDLKFRYEMLKNAAAPNNYTVKNPLDIAYEVFGLSRRATIKEVRNKYTILVKRYHPDINKTPEAAKKFLAIINAYSLISTQ